MPATITNQRRRPPPAGAGHARDHHEPAQAPAPGRSGPCPRPSRNSAGVRPRWERAMPATITNQRRRPPPVGAGHARDHHEPAQASAPGRSGPCPRPSRNSAGVRPRWERAMPATISGLTQALADQSSRYASYSSVETRELNSSSSCHFDMRSTRRISSPMYSPTKAEPSSARRASGQKRGRVCG